MYYASIGLKQIQTHLARSRHLWGRRGASDMLFYLTDTSGRADEIAPEKRSFHTANEVLNRFPMVKVNTDAVDIDGVINLRSDSLDDLTEAAEALVFNIKVNLPAALVESTIHKADRYADVLTAPARQRPLATLVSSRRYLPAEIEFPLAHHCDECSAGMASVEVTVTDEPKRLCADCSSRYTNGRQRTLRQAQTAPQSGFMAEQMMMQSLCQGTVEDFKHLAKLGELFDEDKRRAHTDNHIATVFVDGNGFGALFGNATDKVVTATDDAAALIELGKLKELSKAVKDAVKQGMRDAIDMITADDAKVMSAIPHILGGDDILISVPATKAWTFLMEFLAAVKRGFGDEESIPGGKDVSFSAGMVICNQAFPIGDQVELAEKLLATAKENVGGADWSFAWLDVTNEGLTINPDRVYNLEGWGVLEEMMTLAAQLGRSSKQGNAARGTLRSELPVNNPHDRAIRLRHLAERMPGAPALLDRAFGKGWNKGALKPITDTHVADLRAALNIMRWHR